jgi:hypothetical protein
MSSFLPKLFGILALIISFPDSQISGTCDNFESNWTKERSGKIHLKVLEKNEQQMNSFVKSAPKFIVRQFKFYSK